MELFFLKKKINNLNILRFGHTYGHIFPFPVGPVDWTIPHLMEKNFPVIVVISSPVPMNISFIDEAKSAHVFPINSFSKINRN